MPTDPTDFQFDANVSVDVGVNFEDIEDAPQYSALPNGSYLVEVSGFKGTRPDGTPLTNVNGKPYIALTLKRLSNPPTPPLSGHVFSENFRDRLYIPQPEPGSSTVEAKKFWRFKQIAEACGKPWVGGKFQTAPLVGSRVVVDVVQRAYTGNDGTQRFSNDIKRYQRAN